MDLRADSALAKQICKYQNAGKKIAGDKIGLVLEFHVGLVRRT